LSFPPPDLLFSVNHPLFDPGSDSLHIDFVLTPMRCWLVGLVHHKIFPPHWFQQSNRILGDGLKPGAIFQFSILFFLPHFAFPLLVPVIRLFPRLFTAVPSFASPTKKPVEFGFVVFSVVGLGALDFRSSPLFLVFPTQANNCLSTPSYHELPVFNVDGDNPSLFFFWHAILAYWL